MFSVAAEGAGLRTMDFRYCSTSRAASSRRSRAAGSRTYVVGRQGILVGDQLVRAHEEGHPAPVGVGARPVAARGARAHQVQMGLELGRSQRQEPAQQFLDPVSYT